MSQNASPVFSDLLRSRVDRGRSIWIGVVWLTIILGIGGALHWVADYFDANSRLANLTRQNKVIPLHEWTLKAYKCPTFKAELEHCQQVNLELSATQSVPAAVVKVPLSMSLRKRLVTQPDKPTLLVLSRVLSPSEREWLIDRTVQFNSEWPSQAQIVTLGSTECEVKLAGAGTVDFDPLTEPQKMICFSQNRFSGFDVIPAKDKIEYFIAIGGTTDIGPSRWPILLVENQHVHEVMSFDQLTSSSVILWNLVSLLMPIFVIAFHFVYKGQKTLNTLSDYALCLVLYAGCILLLQHNILTRPLAQTAVSALCIFLEGFILAHLLRYAYCSATGEAWSRLTTFFLSILFSATFIASSIATRQSAQSFLVSSHLWRDALAGTLGALILLAGFYSKQRQAIRMGQGDHSVFQKTTDDFGTVTYFARIACVFFPLVIFGSSNFRELINPTQKILKWEDLFFLPSQTALTAFFLGVKTRTSQNYGRHMKERLAAVFTGVLNLQRALTPDEAISTAVKSLREAFPAATESPFEFMSGRALESEQIQEYIELNRQTLFVPLHGTQTYRGVLRFDNVVQERLSEEEEHFLTTLANALAIHLETQEATASLEEMHQASLRFVPRDFLRLLNSESLADFNLGDHVEIELSVLFADIRNFTQISEGMTPAQNFEFINSFLTQIGPVIRHHGGFIDKYIGDAIMALFPDSPVRAARCAVDIQIALRAFNDKWLGLLNQEVRLGCGIHYGPMVLGIVGYAERLSGTVMSDAVNLASRLESLTKQYSSRVIVSEEVLKNMSTEETNEFETRLLDSVHVKGRSAPVTVYEIIVPGESEAVLEKAS